ncbi:ATP synthase F0 subunit A [Apibacter muscae]|uniref:ATP synthase subunit a n=1 Tax=Apibacter muscae TaxID=2509004 RepID=A0A563DBX4_9FLAO|nr:F0F1 ATP synthase subunit A [Apibacter muscae]TWP27433.1 ATP synthase F0 subunit A [Apibacter muscae]TWP28849.1 ATP synthase F0 subunit A [Apibacter muscae]
MKRLIVFFLTMLLFVCNFSHLHAKASENSDEFNPTEVAMHHIKDSHQFDIWGNNVLFLPIILWTENGLVTFSSKDFHCDDSGQVVVEKKGMKFIKFHEKIYYAYTQKNANGEYISNTPNIVNLDENHHPMNQAPWDFSVTKNVFSMWMSLLVLILIFITAGNYYKSNKYNGVPKGIASVVEPVIVFIRDQVAIPNIGLKNYRKYMPYLLTVFFFIWLNNLMGIIPFFPFGANVTGNIAVTFTLAIITLIITTISGNKNYWKHIFWAPGVPVPMKIFLAPIEVIGMFTKPFSLMVRLFANITAGHIIIISLVSLIFIFKTYMVAPASIVAVVFISMIEILVTALQAYIFTTLSALYFGNATEEHHEQHHENH